ncbi:MAG: hypothetical protein PHD25_12345, partial [Bacteroidales bacterium]|nr:hypothetical protein [Bacteroidales bacterium]
MVMISPIILLVLQQRYKPEIPVVFGFVGAFLRFDHPRHYLNVSAAQRDDQDASGSQLLNKGVGDIGCG